MTPGYNCGASFYIRTGSHLLNTFNLMITINYFQHYIADRGLIENKLFVSTICVQHLMAALTLCHQLDEILNVTSRKCQVENTSSH